MANLKSTAEKVTAPSREAPIVDLQPSIDRKVDALNARLALIAEQDAAELARFPEAPKGK